MATTDAECKVTGCTNRSPARDVMCDECQAGNRLADEQVAQRARERQAAANTKVLAKSMGDFQYDILGAMPLINRIVDALQGAHKKPSYEPGYEQLFWEDVYGRMLLQMTPEDAAKVADASAEIWRKRWSSGASLLAIVEDAKRELTCANCDDLFLDDGRIETWVESLGRNVHLCDACGGLL